MRSKPSAIPHLRWWIGGLLFASTVINYIDRQTLSLLAPYLKHDYHWSNSDYANIVIAFRLAYSAGQSILGRLIDRVGARRGLGITVACYSVISMLTPFANGLRSFALFRFLLGTAESPNWPAATKVVSEWFPGHERGLATAFFDSGSSIGGAIAPFLVLGIYSRWGWRPAFVVPGLLGFLWLFTWLRFYQAPEVHPHISNVELQLISLDKQASQHTSQNTVPGWRQLLKLPQTWGTIVARLFTDPVWFFITDWFPIYLVAKGIELKSGLVAVWVPFIAADLGNFFGGGVSGYLIKGGWPVGAARKAMVIAGGIGVLALIPTIYTQRLSLIALLFGFATFSYATFSTMANVLPSDLFASQSVASVSGFGGTSAGLGTIISFKLIGHFSDVSHSFDPIIVVAAFVPAAGMILVLLLVRNTKATEQGLVRRI